MKIIRFADIDEIPVAHEDPLDPAAVKKVLIKRGEIKDGVIQMINWATLLPGKMMQNHAHADMQEIFIMLHNGASATIDRKEVILNRGDVVIVDLKEQHVMKNQGPTPIEFIVLGIA